MSLPTNGKTKVVTRGNLPTQRVNAHDQIERSDVKLEGPKLDPKYTENGACKLVVQDADKAAAYLDNKQWALHWRENTNLYQSPRTYRVWNDGASVCRFTVASICNSLVQPMQSGIFYETPPFQIRPRPSSKESTSRAKQALYGAQMDKIDFEDTCVDALDEMTLQGTVICKAGWTTQQEIRKRFVRKKQPIRVNMPLGQPPLTVNTKESDEFVVKPVPVNKNEPFFQKCELGAILIDPKWKHPNRLHKAKYVVEVTYPTFSDLDGFREQALYDDEGTKVGGYDIPSEEELKEYFFAHEANAEMSTDIQSRLAANGGTVAAEGENEITSADPLERPIKMLERWDRTYVKTVLVVEDSDKVVLIRNEEHMLPRIPYFAANFWNIPGSGYGLGVGRLAGDDQRIEKGSIEAVLNLLAFIVNPQWVRDRGANAPTQAIRQRLGGIIDVDAPPGRGAKDAFSLVEQPKVDGSLFAVLQEAAQNARSTTGADQAFTQGTLPARGTSSVGRTATGAGAIASANATQIQGPVGHFARGILLPFIEMLDEMDKERLPLSEIKKVLGDELGQEFKLDEDDFLNSQDKFEVLAGAHLAAKKAMAQILPMLIQMLQSPQLLPQLNRMGWTIDVKQLLEMVYEMTEWKNSREVIRRMRPQEEQAFAANNPGIQKAQGDVAKINAKHQATSQEIDQKAEANLATHLTLDPMEYAERHDERASDEAALNAGIGAAG
jgi:hypothetical protein